MLAIAKTLGPLAHDVGRFVRERELRVMHVTAGADVFELALKTILIGEHDRDNRGRFVRLSSPAQGTDRGWRARTSELRGTSAIAPISIAGANDLAVFAGTARALAATQSQRGNDLVIVLVPDAVEARISAAFIEDIHALVAARQLSAVRWIIVERVPALLQDVARRLEDNGLESTCVVNRSLLNAELRQMVGRARTPSQIGAVRALAACR